jgi:hypothetical protein
MFISELNPLSDICYLLQCLAPGMLVIIRIGENGETESVRFLPGREWVEGHSDTLKHVLGKERYESLLAATVFSTSLEVGYDLADYYSDQEYDFDEYYYCDQVSDDDIGYLDITQCDKECGFCGECNYE